MKSQGVVLARSGLRQNCVMGSQRLLVEATLLGKRMFLSQVIWLLQEGGPQIQHLVRKLRSRYRGSRDEQKRALERRGGKDAIENQRLPRNAMKLFFVSCQVAVFT